MAASHADMKGAFGLELDGGRGGREMIDAPMLKQVIKVTEYSCSSLTTLQAENTIRVAKAAGLHIPDV